MSNTPTGFVVIGRNEGDRLVRCLDSLPPPANAIVYVDSGSTDGSIEMAEARGVHVVRLDTTTPFTAGRARNEGFAALKAMEPDAAFVQFIDGDCELDGEWIETAVDFLVANPRIAVVCGRRRERFPEVSIYNRLCDREWDTPVGEADACGGDALMRVDAFATLGGYTGTLVAGEEPELCNRLRAQGWNIWRIDAPMTLHDAAMTRFRQWWMRSVRSGFGYAQVNLATRDSKMPLYGRELGRALLWAGGIPVVIALLALFVSPIMLALLLLYPLQAARIGMRAKGDGRWTYGALMVLSKFPETQGILRYFLQQGGRSEAIVYK